MATNALMLAITRRNTERAIAVALKDICGAVWPPQISAKQSCRHSPRIAIADEAEKRSYGADARSYGGESNKAGRLQLR
jgi:hypothetical protein